MKEVIVKEQKSITIDRTYFKFGGEDQKEEKEKTPDSPFKQLMDLLKEIYGEEKAREIMMEALKRAFEEFLKKQKEDSEEDSEEGEGEEGEEGDGEDGEGECDNPSSESGEGSKNPGKPQGGNANSEGRELSFEIGDGKGDGEKLDLDIELPKDLTGGKKSDEKSDKDSEGNSKKTKLEEQEDISDGESESGDDEEKGSGSEELNLDSGTVKIVITEDEFTKGGSTPTGGEVIGKTQTKVTTVKKKTRF